MEIIAWRAHAASFSKLAEVNLPANEAAGLRACSNMRLLASSRIQLCGDSARRAPQAADPVIFEF
jgi:hypothetical protein